VYAASLCLRLLIRTVVAAETSVVSGC